MNKLKFWFVDSILGKLLPDYLTELPLEDQDVLGMIFDDSVQRKAFRHFLSLAQKSTQIDALQGTPEELNFYKGRYQAYLLIYSNLDRNHKRYLKRRKDK